MGSPSARPRPPESYALAAHGIVRYFGGTQVLRSAGLWAAAGEITTLLGRNGSGKTTLMRIAAGHLRPHGGVVTFDGERRTRWQLAAMARRGLMFVPQTQLLSRAYRFSDHVDVVSRIYGTERVSASLDRVDASKLMPRWVTELSGGERMRASLTLALIRAPTVLVIDEPLAGLAPKDQETVATVLREIAAEGAAVVTSGHDARALLAISDRVLWSVAGTTHDLGSGTEAATHAQFRREYLGPSFG